jgi:hypothetical protein
VKRSSRRRCVHSQPNPPGEPDAWGWVAQMRKGNTKHYLIIPLARASQSETLLKTGIPLHKFQCIRHFHTGSCDTLHGLWKINFTHKNLRDYNKQNLTYINGNQYRDNYLDKYTYLNYILSFLRLGKPIVGKPLWDWPETVKNRVNTQKKERMEEETKTIARTSE